MFAPGRRRYGGRPTDRLAWLLFLSAFLVVLTALLLRYLGFGGDGDAPALVASECAGAECPARSQGGGGDADPDAESCSGADCLPPPPPAEYVPIGVRPPPEITARGAVVIEANCGLPLFAHSAHERLAPASITKIATAIVASDAASLSEVVDVRVNGALMAAANRSSVMGLEPGMRLPLRDLLYGLLLPSGNDAAIAIAEHVAGTTPAFVSMMNARTREMGLANTHFTNPHGLDEPGLYTSAWDIALLGRELLSDPELAPIVSTKVYQPAWDNPPVWSGNKLLYDYPGALGVKTGYTFAAGQTLVAAAERNGRRVIVSLLTSWDRYGDAKTLFEWAFASTSSPCPIPAEAVGPRP